MRRVIYAHVVSVDGFIEDEGETDWSVTDDSLTQHFIDGERDVDAHLYGRKAYVNLSNGWPAMAEDPEVPELFREYARLWIAKPKVVFSKTLYKTDWNTRLVDTDAAEEIRRLKSEPGKDLMLYGAKLAGAMIRAGLVDEIRLYLHPVAFGKGTPMFDLDDNLKLDLIDTLTFGSGVILLRYRPAA